MITVTDIENGEAATAYFKALSWRKWKRECVWI